VCPLRNQSPGLLAARAVDEPLSVVRVVPGESIESALRRFKKILQKDGLTADLRRHDHFVPPSVRRRVKSAAARKRLAKQ
jgi:small subunit ribosomal protein S21